MALGLCAVSLVAAAPGPGSDLYAPYEFMIGEWAIQEEGAPPAAVTRLKWGPNRSYIWISTDLLIGGKEMPHYEGMLVWNGVRKNLDMLLTLDPAGGRVQEQGTVSIAADGTVVRTITAYYSHGVTAPDGSKVGPAGLAVPFEQRFRLAAPGRIETSMMRRTATGWVPTFPGSDQVWMVRIDKSALPPG